MTREKLVRVFKYLDETRACGLINMFAVAPLMQMEYGITYEEAKDFFKKWCDTFNEVDSAEDRAEMAMAA